LSRFIIGFVPRIRRERRNLSPYALVNKVSVGKMEKRLALELLNL
jgi:hypothetical protein